MEALMASSNKTSVKKLIEEDMSNEQQTEKQVANAAKEQIQSDPVCEGNRGKNHKKTKETCKVSTNLESQEFSQTNSAKRLSLLDITSLMEEFCSQIQQHQEIRLHNESGVDSCGTLEYTDSEKHGQPGKLEMHKIEKHSVLQEKLSEAVAAFLNQKLIDMKQFKEDGSIHQSKQFIDALDILNSNKELLLKFLQNSNSLGVKYIREVQDTHTPFEKVKQEKFGSILPKGTGSSERGEELACRKEVQKHKFHNFFRKKGKSQKRDSSEESDYSQVSNRIVVLKPTATSNLSTSTAISPISSPRSHYSLKNEGWSGRSNSPFSLVEIKKRLKNTMGENKKDRQWFFMDGMLHKIPNNQVSEKRVFVPGGNKEEQALEFDVFNQGMIKTELCNKWQETGACPHGEHCQFAHGINELRPVIRHPRYKTEVCRMVLAGDICPMVTVATFATFVAVAVEVLVFEAVAFVLPVTAELLDMERSSTELLVAVISTGEFGWGDGD